MGHRHAAGIQVGWRSIARRRPARSAALARSAARHLRDSASPTGQERGRTQMTRSAAICACLLALPAFSQEDPKHSETTTFALTLKPVGPPVPSFRYELVPVGRELRPNNAALLHHRALHVLADVRP